MESTCEAVVRHGRDSREIILLEEWVHKLWNKAACIVLTSYKTYTSL